MEYRYALTILFSIPGFNDFNSICFRSTPAQALPDLAFVDDWNWSPDGCSSLGANAGRRNHWEPYCHCARWQLNPDVDYQQRRERRPKWHNGRIEWIANGLAYNLDHLSYYGSQLDRRN